MPLTTPCACPRGALRRYRCDTCHEQLCRRCYLAHVCPLAPPPRPRGDLIIVRARG